MTPTPRNPKSYNKTLDLSPEARAALKLPLVVSVPPVRFRTVDIYDAQGWWLASVATHTAAPATDREIAAFIAALVNEALTPAAPMVTIEPENSLELGQLITTELETEQRWTAEEIMRREG